MDDQKESLCSICIEEPTNPFTLPCGHEFCYMCLKRVAQTRKPCPNCNAIIPDFVLEAAKISESKVSKEKVKWLYSGRNNGWWRYETGSDGIIEVCWEIYQKHGQPSSFQLSILGREYNINFDNMTQTGKQGGVTRNIKRIEDDENLIVKGISGLQIVKDEDMPQLPEPEWKDPDEYEFRPDAWEDEEDDEYLDEAEVEEYSEDEEDDE